MTCEDRHYMRIHFIAKATLLSALITGSMAAVLVLLFADGAKDFSAFQEVDTERPAYALVEGAEESGLGELAAHVSEPETDLQAPIDGAEWRVTKKPFGIEIHPETSPVENDRFDGIHVGVDFEVLPEEADIDVPIYAICDGPLRFKILAKGYGGVAVQTCVVDGEDVSVIYGHIRLASVTASSGAMLKAGDRIAVLGTGKSEETDGVRKHLHLGIRKGLTNDIRGYAKDEDETGLWLDVLSLLGLEPATGVADR